MCISSGARCASFCKEQLQRGGATTPAESILQALQQQGFGVVNGDTEYVIISRDARRQHQVSGRAFTGNDEVSLVALRILVTGLEMLEGFTTPPGLWRE